MAEEEIEAKGEQSPKKKGNTLPIVVIVLLLVVLLVIVSVAAIFLMGSNEETGNAPQSTTQEVKAPQPKRNAQDLIAGPMYELKPFIVNLLSQNGKKFLKSQMQLELSASEMQAEIESKEAIIRDTIITILTSKTLEDITSKRGKDKLKEQIVGQINMKLQDGFIKNVYFTDFVIQ